MDHVFTLVADGGYHAELCRMKPDATPQDAEHNFATLAASAARRGMSVVWSRGELHATYGGWNMRNVVKVS